MSKILTILFSLILISVNSFGQYTKLETDNICGQLKKEISKLDTSNKFLREEIILMINILRKNIGKDSLFPFQKFDSVVYVQLEHFLLVRAEDLDKRKRVNRFVVKNDKVNKLLKVVNNPLNFDLGECGTPIREAYLEFWRNNKIIASINFACSLGQLFFFPENILSRAGVLNEKGNKELDKIEFWNK